MSKVKTIRLDPEVLEYKRTPQTIKPFNRRGTINTPDGKRINCLYEENWLPAREGKTFVEGWRISIPKYDGNAIVGKDGNVLKFIRYIRFEAK